MNHSPGPWREHPDPQDHPRRIVDADGVRVCEVHDGEYEPRPDGRNWAEQPRANNMRLIAAAPELLEALRAALWYPWGDGGSEAIDQKEAKKKFRALIARVEDASAVGVEPT